MDCSTHYSFIFEQHVWERTHCPTSQHTLTLHHSRQAILDANGANNNAKWRQHPGPAEIFIFQKTVFTLNFQKFFSSINNRKI